MKIDEATKLKTKMYISVAVVVISFYFIILRLTEVKAWLSDVGEMLSPFIFGIAIAFLLDKPMMGIQKILEKIKFSRKLARVVAAVVALILGILVVVCFFALIGPQLVESLMSLIDQAPTLINNSYQAIVNFFHENNHQLINDVDLILNFLNIKLISLKLLFYQNLMTIKDIMVKRPLKMQLNGRVLRLTVRNMWLKAISLLILTLDLQLLL